MLVKKFCKAAAAGGCFAVGSGFGHCEFGYFKPNLFCRLAHGVTPALEDKGELPGIEAKGFMFPSNFDMASWLPVIEMDEAK